MATSKGVSAEAGMVLQVVLDKSPTLCVSLLTRGYRTTNLVPLLLVEPALAPVGRPPGQARSDLPRAYFVGHCENQRRAFGNGV